MNTVFRRLDYSLRPRLRRETCKRCWRENPVGFLVPDDVWRASVPTRHAQNVLCLMCFDRYAAQRGIDWAASGCEFYPVPGATCSRSDPSWPGLEDGEDKDLESTHLWHEFDPERDGV